MCLVLCAEEIASRSGERKTRSKTRRCKGVERLEEHGSEDSARCGGARGVGAPQDAERVAHGDGVE
eukprot:6206643-Pleurochrysis_carterae.AAC.2